MPLGETPKGMDDTSHLQALGRDQEVSLCWGIWNTGKSLDT